MSVVTSSLLRTSSGATAAPFQIEASQFIYERNSSMMFAGVGAGKTLTYLMTIEDWLAEGVADRVMLVAPLRVINNVWRQEAKKWGSSLSMTICTGELSPQEQREAVEANSDVLLVNNAMLGRVLDYGRHGCKGLVIDELSKYRNPTGAWSKTIRNNIFDVRSGGTGTPSPNGYFSLYGMCHAVGLGRLVGRNFDKWKRKYFYPTDFNQHEWVPFAHSLSELVELIKPFTYVLEDDAVELPPVRKVAIELELPPELRSKYDEMRKTMALSDEQIVAANNGVARNKLRQIVSGFAYRNEGGTASLAADRLDAINDLVDEMQGEPLIIAYEFVEQKSMMEERFKHIRFMGGGTSAAYDAETIKLWVAGKLSLLGMHPASAGHGLNDLELAGSAIAWWQPGDDYELFDQLMGRLTRRAQKASHVRAFLPIAVDTIDEAVFTRLGHKEDSQAELWNALRV